MKNCNLLPEFEKNFKQLFKRYRTLKDDFEKLKEILLRYPAGIGKNFTVIHSERTCKIIKARMACRALRDRSLRVIYAYAEEDKQFYFIELYFKGEQANENRTLINDFLRQFK
ncbi:hypothetical protein A3I27_00290 [Candidatus Giovannonibacteria bacterium RIFCSPLOWO2_02_FULL_43_11b]|uniref:Addiction module toxin RelE n=1 Tax=Candidatus Giovannonibacteria bacterium RIFCSPHIGHO2_12_FULL_43_15 TaxID=1798341 RepID=A0A1F5WNC7_9BACT|nr:MAG: hypothetical protein A2739_02460 [Candidatus Giovannonibacteria bacterium RIFCSPHIGHO2_01_FULL_43_100]OGF65902.1 MAG: hypothetical protein A3B97_02775 [Candidatus Giovannonibacteria bacterium RIFCSPHIGHO2_02_FULL_43_32]OGF77189.1 MAG: hypothetical protein A3F23_01440 [Candidatus Giovannonibacteria bacterium RIFCSPHIGHO2_12_FULL_43_15]OGF78608.1 MAG: hypothetical protein A3A15_03020 [Candidatus Giovannonibacteria bacterium RIFCSPLOWO2_01_FULL_43_60]OGF90434.1 MAG: hypothetical protein A3